jgi:hypothetical protein
VQRQPGIVATDACQVIASPSGSVREKSTNDFDSLPPIHNVKVAVV